MTPTWLKRLRKIPEGLIDALFARSIFSDPDIGVDETNLALAQIMNIHLQGQLIELPPVSPD